MPVETILLILVVLAGAYMAWNIGANDVANAMGTSVGSGALTLRQAVIVAAFLEFGGAFFLGSHVSETIQGGIVDSAIFKDPMILVFGMLASLVAAGAWLQLASYYGWPVSTTHTIVGAIVGFGLVVGGSEAVYWDNIAIITASWIFSPVLGGVASFFIFNLLRKSIFYADRPVVAARKMTPYLVFGVVFILALILLYKGLSNIQLQLTFIESTAISASVGLIAMLITRLILSKASIAPVSHEAESYPEYQPKVADQLEKARRHLLQVQAASKGVIQVQTDALLQEVSSMVDSLKQKEQLSLESTEYALVEKIFGYLQIMSACLMAFAHGANDVANAIGPLAAAITVLTTGVISSSSPVPTWALALGGAGIVVGLATWGWRVIETIGKKITELTPTRGFAAEFGAATTILIASRLGLPVSTTHILVGSVIGVGLARGLEALDLRTTRYIFLSWLVTVPAGALVTIVFFYLFKAIFT